MIRFASIARPSAISAVLLSAIASFVALVAAPSAAHATVIVTAVEANGDVVLTGTGTIDLTGLSLLITGTVGNGVNVSLGNLMIGDASATDVYALPSLSGPASFGPGGGALTTGNVGDAIGISLWFSRLYVTAGYASGSPLSGSSTISGQTFASVGLTPGTVGLRASEEGLGFRLNFDAEDLYVRTLEHQAGGADPTGLS